MDILSDYRITSRIASDAELSRHAEWARVALERAATPVPAPSRSEVSTGSLACIPVSN